MRCLMVSVVDCLIQVVPSGERNNSSLHLFRRYRNLTVGHIHLLLMADIWTYVHLLPVTKRPLANEPPSVNEVPFDECCRSSTSSALW